MDIPLESIMNKNEIEKSVKGYESKSDSVIFSAQSEASKQTNSPNKLTKPEASPQRKRSSSLNSSNVEEIISNGSVKPHQQFEKINANNIEVIEGGSAYLNQKRYTVKIVEDERVIINVSGTRFETYKITLELVSESRLAHLSPTNSDYDPIKREYFFDRDPHSFSAILNYFRTGKLHAPNDVCGNLFHEELNFWGIGERSIQPCCWSLYSSKRDCEEMLQNIEDEEDGISFWKVYAVYYRYYID
jgi:hypothetical protein